MVNGCFDPPICQELPDNREVSFFQQLRQGNVDVATNNNDDGNLEDEVQELPAVPKLASYREAISCLEDVLHLLESKGNADTADSLSKGISNVQRDWLQRRTSQKKVSNFFFKIVTLKDNRLNLQYSTHTFNTKQGLCLEIHVKPTRPVQLCSRFIFRVLCSCIQTLKSEADLLGASL